MSPWILGFSLFFGYPLVMSVYLSFNHYDLLSPPRWVGLANYRYMFSGNDPQVRPAILNTLWLIGIAVPLQVIGRDVEDDGDVRLQARGQVELVGRELEHVDGAAVHILQAQHPDADVAADAHVAASLAADVADQRRGCRLAVGASDGDDLRPLVRRRSRDGAGEQLDVAHDFDVGRPGLLDGPVWLGVGQRHAGREHQRRELQPVGAAQILQHQPLGLGGVSGSRTFVPHHDLGAAGAQSARRSKAGAGKAEHGDLLSLETADRDHDLRLSSPTAA